MHREPTAEMAAMEALLTRRSVRSFTNQPVSEQDMCAILRAGMFAPSAHNRRTWEMITVTERDTLDALAPLSRWWGMLKAAPLCIACCAHSPHSKPEDEEFLIQNGAAATQNMLLAIHSLGLGGVWLGIHPLRPYYGDVKALLSIPDHVRVVSLIAVGHISEPLPHRSPPEDRFEQEKWHKEKY